jgi:hypothetical protein
MLQPEGWEFFIPVFHTETKMPCAPLPARQYFLAGPQNGGVP